MRVLLVKTSSMGDVVHALPLVTDMAEALPGATIDWVVEEGFADIARLHPAVRRVIPVALRRWRRAMLRPATWREVEAARASVRGAYDAALDCQGLLKSAWVAHWAGCPIYGYDRDSAREPLAARLYRRGFAVPRDLHAIARNRTLGAAAFRYTADGAPRFGLRVGVPHGDAAALVQRPFAMLLTNASRPTKLLPDAHWHALADALAARGLRCVLPWGSAAERADTERRAAAMRDALVAPRLALAALAPVLATARVVIGIDTGLTHLAAAVAAPTVGVFCDYDPRLVGVTGDAPCVNVGDGTGVPALAEVLAGLEQVLASPSDQQKRVS